MTVEFIDLLVMEQMIETQPGQPEEKGVDRAPTSFRFTKLDATHGAKGEEVGVT